MIKLNRIGLIIITAIALGLMTVGQSHGDAVVDAAAVAKLQEAHGGNPNFVPNWPGVIAEIENANANKTKYHLLAAAALAAVLKWLLDLLMHLKQPRDRVKQVLPWLLSVGGVIIAVLDSYIGGASLPNALVLGGAAPGAVLVNELGNALKAALQKPGSPTDSASEAGSPPNSNT